MEWNVISQFIDPQLLIVIAFCGVIGFILKQTPAVPDWTIVYIVAVVGVVSAGLIVGFTILGIIQGFLCGAVAVYGSQVIKQTKEAVGGGDDASKKQ